jgi:hypothetical protein
MRTLVRPESPFTTRPESTYKSGKTVQTTRATSEGIKPSDIKFRKGSLLIDLGPSNPDDPLAGSDQIHFTDFNGDYPELTAAVGELRFADGSTMNYADILAQGFDLDGTALDDLGDDALIGTSVTDRIRGFAGQLQRSASFAC